MESAEMKRARRLAARYQMSVRKSKAGGYRLFYEDTPVASVNDRKCAAMTLDQLIHFLTELATLKIEIVGAIELKGATANVQ